MKDINLSHLLPLCLDSGLPVLMVPLCIWRKKHPATHTAFKDWVRKSLQTSQVQLMFCTACLVIWAESLENLQLHLPAKDKQLIP